jgi:hypothetical protein
VGEKAEWDPARGITVHQYRPKKNQPPAPLWVLWDSMQGEETTFECLMKVILDFSHNQFKYYSCSIQNIFDK